MHALLHLLACADPESVDGDSAGLEASPDVVSLSVSPETATIRTGPTGGAPTPFTVTATFADGSAGVLPVAEWSLSNSVTGSIDDSGVFTPAAGTGGVTYVTARFAGVQDSSQVTVLYTDEIVNEGADPTLFDGAEVPADSLWTYPQDGVNFPRNTPGITFQWTDMLQSTARLRFTSGVTDITVYATGNAWTADESLWQIIAATNAGGTVNVDLAVAAAGQVYVQPAITLNVNRMDGAGTVYYWSTSVQGSLRIPYAGSAEVYLTDPKGDCIGCHAIGGGKIAYSIRDTVPGSPLRVAVNRVSDLTLLLPDDAGVIGDFKAWSPDGNYFVVTSAGSLLLYDGNTFQFLNEIPVGAYATQPDWSPDGTQLAFVLPQNYTGDSEFTNGAIAVMDWLGDGMFGPATVLYDAPDPFNAFYPAWSPDSRWIAFNESTDDSYDDDDAALWVIARGGGEPVELAAANMTPNIINSYPRWGPLPDDDVLWLAFSSVRPYGGIVDHQHQVWVAGFDPARAEAGEDPSWPAFWLPGQDVHSNNHVPVWYDQ